MAIIMKLAAITVLIAALSIFEVKGATQLAISHCNDVSGQIESFVQGTRDYFSAPEPCYDNADDCVGGFTNVVHWLHDKSQFLNVNENNILRLSTGNMIGGESGWISSMPSGWKEFGKLVKNHINPSAMAFGIKEFGAGIPRTIGYMNEAGNSTFTLANTCNGNQYSGTEQQFCNTLNSTRDRVIIINISKADLTPLKIGIIGFVNPIVTRLALPGRLEFADIVNELRNEINKHSDVQTFIAIGDGSLSIAQSILDSIDKVKVVIYGSGFSIPPDMTGHYPLPYKHGFIATAGRYGSSVGKMLLDIEDNGNVVVRSSSLVVTNTPKEYNEDAKKVNLAAWKDAVATQKNALLGVSRVELKGGKNCWYGECNLGNLMTDAVVNCALQKLGDQLEEPVHAVWHGGAFFEDIVPRRNTITKFDVHRWLPYHNNVHLVKVKGSDLWKLFELSATGIDLTKPNARNWRHFLQVSSGIEVHYDTISNPETSHVTRVRVTHDEDGVPRLKDLEVEAYYYLAIPTYLYEGRGVYEGYNTIWIDESNLYVGFDDDCLANYINALKVTSVGFEERIWINDETASGGGSCPSDKPCECKGRKTAVTVTLTIVFFSIILAVIYIGFVYVIPRLRQSNSVQYPPNQL